MSLYPQSKYCTDIAFPLLTNSQNIETYGMKILIWSIDIKFPKYEIIRYVGNYS